MDIILRSRLILCTFFIICCIDSILSVHYERDQGRRGACDDNWDNHPNYNTFAERVYYVACVEDSWDYAPSGKNLITGDKITESSLGGFWLHGNGEDRIGSRYIKTMYREFTDNCFKDQMDFTDKWKHLGSIGPVIRARVGETIKIYYQNFCTIPTSMHPHGVQYDKTSEGAPYDDGSTDGDIIKPGHGWIYIWEAREGTVDEGASSKMWLYHSHVDEIRDIHSGLIGAIIITKPGYERSDYDLMPRDVSREYVTFFVAYNENESFMMEKNVDQFLDDDFKAFEDIDFMASNVMYSINGYLFGNLKDLVCVGGEQVRWYTASFGDEIDGPHSPHWHGNIAVTTYGDHTDAVVLIPGTTSTVTMTIDAFGKWLYHCHVFEHIEAGMITTYSALRDYDDYDDSDDSSSSSSSSSSENYSPEKKTISSSSDDKYDKYVKSDDKSDDDEASARYGGWKRSWV